MWMMHADGWAKDVIVDEGWLHCVMTRRWCWSSDSIWQSKDNQVSCTIRSVCFVHIVLSWMGTSSALRW